MKRLLLILMTVSIAISVSDFAFAQKKPAIDESLRKGETRPPLSQISSKTL